MLRGQTLHVAGVSTKLDLVVIPLAEVSDYEGRPIAGILGSSFIERFLLTIDYQQRFITLATGPSARLGADTQTIALEMRNEEPWARVAFSLDGKTSVSGLFMVDTGANASIDVSPAFVSAVGIAPVLSRLPAVDTRAITPNGLIDFREARIKHAQLGPFRIKEPLLAWFQSGSHWGDGLLGADVLRRFTVTLDYRSRLMKLQPNSDFRKPFETNASGLLLKTHRSDPTAFEVAWVRRSSPADTAGIQVGDVLLSVNSRRVNELGLNQLVSWFQRDSKTYQLGTKRGDEHRTVRLRTKRPI
jgi:hypothetical protein